MKNININLEKDLKKALKNDELSIYFQPIISLREGKITGTEALLRWKRPVLGFISPAEFIPIAENSGLMVDIGAWILEKSAEQTLKWHHQGFTTLSLKVSINFSAQQLKQGNAVEILDKVIKKTGIDPKFIQIEITEESLLDETLEPKIKEISNKGIHISLDDFGKGVSSMKYLKSYNIHTLKIDKSLINEITTNQKSAETVSAILAMAKELDIDTLAEGLETKEQLEFLQAKDCMYVQGFYFCKPLDSEKFTRLLEQHLVFFDI